jgi:pullulanase
VYYFKDKSKPQNKPEIKSKIMKAKFEDYNKISFEINNTIGIDSDILKNIRVTSDNETCVIKNIEESSNGGLITLENDMQLDKNYILFIDGLPTKEILKSSIYDTSQFEEKYFYDGELGSIYSKSKTIFRVWSPIATTVTLNLYSEQNVDIDMPPNEEIPMQRSDNGVWEISVDGDLNGVFYQYRITLPNEKESLVGDIYAKSVGVNGVKSMVIDLEETNPTGWDKDKGPKLQSSTDAIIYELHVRDLSMDENSGIKNEGKFLGLTETGTKSKEGLSTGLDSIKELGITHIHLLPVFDYDSIDETKLEENNFNWGYDPRNFNAPEGSYSTDPYSGYTRIEEFKQMVKSIHDNDMGVIMDVVYNHTYKTEDSTFNKTVPEYYYRTNEQGVFTNGSGTGNETASERAMVNKFFVDSVVYWAKEYHVDGFRFDLMGLHDVKLMNDIREALDKINPEIIVYGEGWTGGTSPLPESERAVKMNAPKVSDRIAFFSDDIRNAIKGSVFENKEKGFISGNFSNEEDIKYGIVASLFHPQIDYTKTDSKVPWAISPTQTITYASAHDNLTLWDKLLESADSIDEGELVKMNKLSAAIMLTSQGIPFIHAGEEFARSKDGDENSYKSSDDINKLKWSNKSQFKGLFDYYAGLIKLRSNHPAFRMTEATEVANKITFLDTDSGTVAYTIKDNANGDKWSDIAIIFNSNENSVEVALPQAGWVLVVNEDIAGIERLAFLKNDVVTVPAKSAYVLVDSDSFGYTSGSDENIN